MTEVAYAVEGWGDEPVATKLIKVVGCIPRRVLIADGKSRLDPKIQDTIKAPSADAGSFSATLITTILLPAYQIFSRFC